MRKASGINVWLVDVTKQRVEGLPLGVKTLEDANAKKSSIYVRCGRYMHGGPAICGGRPQRCWPCGCGS